nr:hypothetical protein [Acidiferrobacter sp. SPIII_3]
MGIEQLANHPFRLRPHELGDLCALLEELHGRQAAHAEAGRQTLLFVAVDLGKKKPALVLFSQFGEDRHEGPAGPAPCRPEVNQYRRLARAGEDGMIEAALGDVGRVRRRGHGSPFDSVLG